MLMDRLPAESMTIHGATLGCGRRTMNTAMPPRHDAGRAPHALMYAVEVVQSTT
ncbi:hypothetical protein FIBSPDRAFT_861805, partial [Athelia psychrophila]